jgi:hypothetical protein
MIVFICVLIITAVTLFLPWYNINGDVKISSPFGDSEVEFNYDYYLQEYENETSVSAMGISYSMSGSDDYSDDEDIETPMNVTYYLTLISIILCILVVILVGIAIFGFLSPKIALSIGIIVMILILVAMVYFPIGLPNGLKKDFDETDDENKELLIQFGFDYDGSFMGSSKNTTDFAGVEGTFKGTWGPGLGWFFIIVAFVMAIIGISLIARAGKGVPRPYPPRPHGYPEQPPRPSRSPPPQQPPPPRRDYYDDRSRGQYYDQKPRDRGYDSGYTDDYNRY